MDLCIVRHGTVHRSDMYYLNGVSYVYLAVAPLHSVLHMVGDGLANP